MPPAASVASRSDPARSHRQVQSVQHAVDVLHLLSEADRPLGVSELARRTNLNKSTVFHLLSTLRARHLVVQDVVTSRYQVSWGLYALGASMVRNHSVSQAVRGRLESLAQATGETILVGILDEGAVLYIDRAESPSRLSMVANIGRRGPLHAVATGKVLLAHSPDASVETLLASPLPRFTPSTITDADELRSQLVAVREQGFARCWQEHEPGVSSVSVPVLDHTGNVVAALTIAGRATRLTARALRRQLVPLRQAAEEIQSRLVAAVTPDPNTSV